jgi:hypothetical protein
MTSRLAESGEVNNSVNTAAIPDTKAAGLAEVNRASCAPEKSRKYLSSEKLRNASIISSCYAEVTHQAQLFTKVHEIKELDAESFAFEFIVQGLRGLNPGSNVLVLSDGKESKSAGSFALEYTDLNIFSTDYDFPDAVQRVDIFGFGYNRVKLDNTKPIDAGLFGSPDTKFSSVMMFKGLCDHHEWQDNQGRDAGPVGCSGVALNEEGISALLAKITLLLTQGARFSLHGEINFMDKQAEHQALSSKVQKEIIKGVEKFNIAYGDALASVHVADTGLVIAGETLKSLDTEQAERLESMVSEYFSQDRGVSCETYKKNSE